MTALVCNVYFPCHFIVNQPRPLPDFNLCFALVSAEKLIVCITQTGPSLPHHCY